jgi:uncharacterized repeat protein (TIGR01451 family)
LEELMKRVILAVLLAALSLAIAVPAAADSKPPPGAVPVEEGDFSEFSCPDGQVLDGVGTGSYYKKNGKEIGTLPGVQIDEDTVRFGPAPEKAAYLVPTYACRSEADLVVDKTASQTSVTVPGDDFTYTIQLTNLGPSPAENVKLSDVLPYGLIVDLEASTLPPGCYFGIHPRALECGPFFETLGTLQPGESVTVVLAVVTTSRWPGDDWYPYINTAGATTTTFDPDTANNSDTVVLPVTSVTGG